MEDVLEVYTRPYDPRYPQVCMDEVSKQLLRDTRQSLPMEPGRAQRQDYEYERGGGVVNLFMFCEPLQGRRWVDVTERRTKCDWAHQIKELVDERYPEAERIVLVMDNLNTHTPPPCMRRSIRPRPSGSPTSWRSTTRPSTVAGSTWPRSS
jgi:hypothetical protein